MKSTVTFLEIDIWSSLLDDVTSVYNTQTPDHTFDSRWQGHILLERQ